MPSIIDCEWEETEERFWHSRCHCHFESWGTCDGSLGCPLDRLAIDLQGRNGLLLLVEGIRLFTVVFTVGALVVGRAVADEAVCDADNVE